MQVNNYLYLCFIYAQVMCEDSGIVKSKNPLPYFRRQVEELTEDTSVQTTLAGDLSLVSFLIKNVKEIYNELDEFVQVEKSTSVCTSTTQKVTTPGLFFENIIESSTITAVTALSQPSRTHSNEMAINTNVSLVHFSDKEITDVESSTASHKLAEQEELMHLSKNLITYETDRKQRDNEFQTLITRENGSLGENESNSAGHFKSCIFCNNVEIEDCGDPRNRFIAIMYNYLLPRIPATVCEHDDDLCYSMHTPFGVIDRGCFNPNYNLTTYVCSCNLCNYISISEMPYIFSKKQEWVHNVVELSRTRHFRKSVFKDMSCLKCESNATVKSGDMLDAANCLEGNIGSLPTEECEIDEICAVKAIRKDGYLWRGCVKNPLFNYWWALCDSDLCNYDPLASVYDTC